MNDDVCFVWYGAVIPRSGLVKGTPITFKIEVSSDYPNSVPTCHLHPLVAAAIGCDNVAAPLAQILLDCVQSVDKTILSIINALRILLVDINVSQDMLNQIRELGSKSNFIDTCESSRLQKIKTMLEINVNRICSARVPLERDKAIKIYAKSAWLDIMALC